MKKSNTTALGALAIFLSGLMIGACANTKIDTELPASHPANPAAETTVLVPPPNPFAMNTSAEQPGGLPVGTGKQSKHQEGAGNSHEMQTMKPQSVAPAGSQEKSTEHQH